MLSNNSLKFFADFIAKELGIIYSESVYYQLDQRLQKVAELLKIKDPEELFSIAVRDGITGNFKNHLLNIATNNETSFFRDPKIFNAVEKVILPNLIKEFPGGFSYRIWSAATSFGQEPYSIAILANELKELFPQFPRIEILGTDISDQALDRAKSSIYSDLEVQRGLSDSRLNKYFIKESEGAWKLKTSVSSLVEFSKKNLLDSFSMMGSFHLILCRYVLIYQNQEKKKEILQKLIQCLVPKGYLILGGSESIIGLTDQLDQLDFDGAIYYRKK